MKIKYFQDTDTLYMFLPRGLSVVLADRLIFRD